MSTFVVTGGGGFLGSALCIALRGSGHEVRSLARGDYPGLRARGVDTMRADLAEAPERWAECLSGADGVFHVAAKVDLWGNYADFERTNVRGTKNVIEQARRHGVRRLVFTSSPSVVANGCDLCGVDESQPYPESYDAFYPQTKALAEQFVLRANDAELFTCALRPHLIWGPGDTNLLPRLITRARAGRLFQIGDGANLVDTCFIDDCVRAHRLAMEALERNTSARGKAYFVSQGEPVPMWTIVNDMLRRSGVAPVRRRIPLAVALGLAGTQELLARLSPWPFEPSMTRFLVKELATSHYFNISRARNLLGYEPQYTIAQALDLTFATREHRGAV